MAWSSHVDRAGLELIEIYVQKVCAYPAWQLQVLISQFEEKNGQQQGLFYKYFMIGTGGGGRTPIQ